MCCIDQGSMLEYKCNSCDLDTYINQKRVTLTEIRSFKFFISKHTYLGKMCKYMHKKLLIFYI